MRSGDSQPDSGVGVSEFKDDDEKGKYYSLIFT